MVRVEGRRRGLTPTARSSRSPGRLNTSSSLSLANNGGADNEATLAEIACMLVEAGANVNKVDHDNFTPLMYGTSLARRRRHHAASSPVGLFAFV